MKPLQRLVTFRLAHSRPAALATTLAMVLTASLAFQPGSVSAQTENADNPAAMVEATSGRILNELNRNRARFDAHPEELRELIRRELLGRFDLDYSARLVLGRHSRGASPEQIEAFAQAMSELLIDRYADGLLRFDSKEQLQVLPIRGEIKDRLTRVRTRIVLDNGAKVPVDYALHKTDTGWQAFDVTVEGISYVATYRNQIGPQVQAEGLEAVTRKLESGEIELEDEPESNN